MIVGALFSTIITPAMELLATLVILSQLLVVSGQYVMFTHPETYTPASSGLILQPVPLHFGEFRNVSASRNTTSTTSRPNRFQEQCTIFQNEIFRTIDGSCNTLANRGQSMQPLARFLPAAFSDGLSVPRQTSVRGVPLPSPRLVSRAIHPDVLSTSELTIFIMAWGQLMDHEMVSTPIPIEDTRGTIQCCEANAEQPTGLEVRECFPILFPPDPDFKGTCMEFIRSRPVRDDAGNIILPRENENVITSFIDASTVYGSDQAKLDRVRDPSNPHLLRVTPDNFLPDNGMDDCVKRNGTSDVCFLAGDDRVNEHAALTLLHTILVRYHNILATQLKHFHPNSSDELIFQQARAIVGAVMQNIFYGEWLPIILGGKIRKKFDLDLNPYFCSDFDSKQDPRIFQAFSTAVFRFGHTLIPRSLPLSLSRRLLLRELFFKPFEARENLDTLAAGMLTALDTEDRAQPFDRFIVAEVTSHLFENQEGQRRGFDLVALNLQRGRDHAIPPYNAYRRALGLRPVTSFSDPVLGDAGPSLASVYSDPEDIELFSGGISEPSHAGGLVGETFGLLMAMQFHRLKFGDRFFYTHERRHGRGFTNAQVKLIYNIRLAHVLCMTTNVVHAQPNVFRVPGPHNHLRDCEDYRREHPSMWSFKNYPL